MHSTQLLVPDPSLPDCGIDDVRAWLRASRARDGGTLESKLAGGSFDRQLRRCVRAYADGPRGFPLNLNKVRFPNDARRFARLKEGIEAGAITGIAIEAYPDAARLGVIACRVNPADPAAELTAMQQEPVAEFLLKHFIARGGQVRNSIRWGKVKWPRNGEQPWKIFHERAARSGHNTTDYLDARKWETLKYSHAFLDALKSFADQPTVQDVYGSASMFFTNTQRIVSQTSKILGADGVTALAQGEGLSFIALLQQKVDALTPAEYLALVTAISTPAKTKTYPDLDVWVWLTGFHEGYALVYSDEFGLCLDPTKRASNAASAFRVRSVVR